MDRSVPLPPDPVPGPISGERRRSVRQKLHTPVYASFNGSETGMVVDLSELLDLSEDGFAVQTSERLQKDRAVKLCLDLPETNNFIHGTGKVVWSDDAGRGGIRFSALSESSRKILKEWLLSNLLIGCSNHAARSEQLAHREQDQMAGPTSVHESDAISPIASVVGRPASLQVLRAQIRAASDDVDVVLQRITEHAMTLTGASGAAMAFFSDGKMVCRARAGQPAPPLGATLDTSHGLTGECVRSGRLVSCEDVESDPRVDPAVCRVLGVGSLLAAPILSDFHVVGVLEVLCRHSHAFTGEQARLLDQIVEMIPEIQTGDAEPENAEWRMSVPPGSPPSNPLPYSMLGVAEESAAIPALSLSSSDAKARGKAAIRSGPQAQLPDPEPMSPPSPRLLYRALLGLATSVAVIALGYALGPTIKDWLNAPHEAHGSFVKEVKAAENSSMDPAQDPGRTESVRLASAAPGWTNQGRIRHNLQPKSLPDLRRLADAGDADAQWLMGVRYHDGAGVAHDDGQAVHWFLRAAEQGNVAAQGALGAYYWRGRGVSPDLSKAYFWSTIALARGDEVSKSRIEGLSSQMTPNQVAEARQQAEAWILTHSQPAR